MRNLKNTTYMFTSRINLNFIFKRNIKFKMKIQNFFISASTCYNLIDIVVKKLYNIQKYKLILKT